MIDTVLESSTHMGPIIGYVISRIFQCGVIIPNIVAFQACSLHRGNLEKWLIQFLNPLLMAGNICYMPFPNFFSIVNNSKYCSISGLFSVLGAPRKIIVTVLESSTHGDQS